MKKLLLISFFLFPTFCLAQIIDNSAIEELNNSNISFVEGEFVVYLADTVSPTFIADQFLQFDAHITFYGIEPLIISLVNSPTDSTLKKLGAHPKVVDVYKRETVQTFAEFDDELKKLNLTSEEYQVLRLNFIPEQPSDIYLLTFDYSVNETILKQIMNDFRDVAYFLKQNLPHVVNVKVEPGKELDTMDKIEALPFVRYTAMIASPLK